MSGPKPLTRQRSEWSLIPAPDMERWATDAGGEYVGTWWRNVSDGQLRVIVTKDPPAMAWHLSISFVDAKMRPSRYPRWDEITDARYRLGVIPDEVTMAMLLPPPDKYVAVHDTTFHLHELVGL